MPYKSNPDIRKLVIVPTYCSSESVRWLIITRAASMLNSMLETTVCIGLSEPELLANEVKAIDRVTCMSSVTIKKIVLIL